jgi:hypothetical protein
MVPKEMFEFYKFQGHRKSGLPKVLQGKVSMSPDVHQAKTKGPITTSPNKQET